MSELLNKNFVDFTGGLNFTDSELNMKDNYLVEARNVELVYDSTIKKRNGFKLVKSLWSGNNRYNTGILWDKDIKIAFLSTGEIATSTTGYGSWDILNPIGSTKTLARITPWNENNLPEVGAKALVSLNPNTEYKDSKGNTVTVIRSYMNETVQEIF